MTKKPIRGQFDSRFEIKRLPIPPRKICRNTFFWFLGIVSPSLLSTNFDDDVNEYRIKVLKHLRYKRQIKAYQRRTLYRRVREEQAAKIIFQQWFEKLEKGWMAEYDRGEHEKKEISGTVQKSCPSNGANRTENQRNQNE